MSLDAYRRNVGGSITIAVTGTDNPVPDQLSERRTPPQPTPAVPQEAEATQPDASGTSQKPSQEQQS